MRGGEGGGPARGLNHSVLTQRERGNYLTTRNPISLSHHEFGGEEEPTHHKNRFNYHRYHNASKPPGDKHHNKRLKHPGLDPLQPNTTCLFPFTAGWFDRECSCRRLVAAQCAQPSSNPPSKIDTRLVVSCDASIIFRQWLTKSHHFSSKPSLPPGLRSDGGMLAN